MYLLQKDGLVAIEKAELKNLIISTIGSVEVPTEDELYRDLSEMDIEADKAAFEFLKSTAAIQITDNDPVVHGRNIFQKIRRIICKILAATDIIEDVTDAIIEAVKEITKIGALVLKIIQKLIKFIMQKGYEWLCPVATDVVDAE